MMKTDSDDQAIVLASILNAAGVPFDYVLTRDGDNSVTNIEVVPRGPSQGPSQPSVQAWLEACFGAEEARCNPDERAKRFLEEALEAVQSYGLDREQVQQLTDYVFSRSPDPDIGKELGGVVVTALLFAEVTGLDLYECGATEFVRCLGRIEVIREKQKAKPDAVKGQREVVDTSLTEAERRSLLTSTLTALRDTASRLGQTDAVERLGNVDEAVERIIADNPPGEPTDCSDESDDLGWGDVYTTQTLARNTVHGRATHLRIQRHDGAEVSCPWSVIQQIKNDVLGPDVHAIEVFPPESELVNDANIRHLFALPAGVVPPLM